MKRNTQHLPLFKSCLHPNWFDRFPRSLGRVGTGSIVSTLSIDRHFYRLALVDANPNAASSYDLGVRGTGIDTPFASFGGRRTALENQAWEASDRLNANEGSNIY